MKKLFVFLPLFLSGCALFNFQKYPVPDAAVEVANGDKVAHWKMNAKTIEEAYAWFDQLYDVVSDRFGPIKIAKPREGQKHFSPDLFCRWPQTDDHLGVDLYVENWRRHPEPSLRGYGIVVDIYMRDFRAQDRQTKADLIKRYGEEGAKKFLDKNGNLLP